MNVDIQQVDRILEDCPERPEQLIQVLQDINQAYNFLPEEALRKVSRHLAVPLADVYGVATFYNAFSLVPRGRHIVRICQGTACHVRGATQISDEFKRQLSLEEGQTSADLQWTLEGVNCVGACALGPVVVVGEAYHGKVSSKGVKKIIKATLSQAKEAVTP